MHRSSDSTPRQINVRIHEDITVVTVLVARIDDQEQSSALRDELESAIREGKNQKIVIDLRNVEYMTSVGVVPLAAARRAAEEFGGRIVLCNLNDLVAKVLTVTQLIVETRAHVRHFAVSEDIEAAFRLLNEEAD
jgi:anti-anti-sigma factor